MNSNIENAGLKKLKEAFQEINQWEYENLHLDTLEEIIPSTQYKKCMERLIKRQKQPYWKYINTIGKRVAVLMVATALTFALSMSVSAVRKPVVEFFVNAYEKFVEFFYDEDDVMRAPDTIETVYTLGYVPDGYEFVKTLNLYGRVKHVWKNNISAEIVFSQYILNGDYALDKEKCEFELLNVDGTIIAYIDKYELKKFYWNNDNYAYQLAVDSSFSIEECLQMINSISKQNI